tara:strand:- start:865 stop:1869 length:1005 start_codon:yes stop_codon:yes gene_type:complete
VEAWEIDAREQIRHLVASYNALGDRGQFEELLTLFAPDATMDIGDGQTYDGTNDIRSIFTTTRDSLANESRSEVPRYLQHHAAAPTITIEGPEEALGQSYFTVMTDAGVDHWGRYQDKFRPIQGHWLFASRRVLVDGTTPGGWADQRLRAATAEDTSTRISPPERLLAEADIRQLVARYALATDRRDLDALVALFVPEVRVGGGLSGRVALREDLTRQLAAIGVTILHVGTHQIDFENPDNATGYVYCRAEVQDGRRWIHQSIRYDDQYQRINGIWLFVKRSHRLFYGAEVGVNPLGLSTANWPNNHDGWGTLPAEDETWQDFQAMHGDAEDSA